MRALARKLASCGDACELLSAQAVGNAVYGLQALPDSEEARELVAELVPLVPGNALRAPFCRSGKGCW